jgi:hypothetical protein
MTSPKAHCTLINESKDTEMAEKSKNSKIYFQNDQ